MNKKERFLLQDRRSISKHWEDWWFFWWKVEDWENPEDCLKREIKEELDLENFDYTKVFKWDMELGGSIINCNCFLYVTDKIYSSDFEVLEWDWARFFWLIEMKRLKFPAPWNTQKKS